MALLFSNHNNNNDEQLLHRLLQSELPDYTSPPLDDAIEATPEAFREDFVIDAMRDLDAAGNCTAAAVVATVATDSNNTNSTTDIDYCQIPFEPTDPSLFDKTSPLGVMLYGGALVDPRSYAVLARRLTDRYGLTVVIPVFANDLQFVFGVCNSGRLALAQAAFPDIEKWLFVGHSFGGVAAMTDVWIESEMGTQLDNSEIAGLVLLASDVQPLLCPGTFIDYSGTDLPMAAVTASEDQILNMTRWEENTQYLSSTATIDVIEGGNHGQFGDYNDTLRAPLLGQVDGKATITKYTQWDLTVDAIFDVAQQSGLELPEITSSATSSEFGSSNLTMPLVMLVVSFVWAWRK